MHEQESTRLGDEIARLVRMGARFRGMFKTEDLGAEFSALMLLPPLRAMGPMRVTDLAEFKQADPSTVSRQAAQLVRAGLARREADPADGRASRLAVTEAGVQACERVREVRAAMLERALADWPAERITAFTDLFEEFNHAVEALLRTDPTTPQREPA
ncbi:transcriptional regulator [Actinoplanes lobatus]|uniref:Transcriptional regulator n=1 Tax=Actinoplanes lobatus TaxID=113568 RepID=A0A7W7HE87_9ACTN|nr:MarR family transcriptional regulator [Actinoplanes lobatus]MBB4748914.1 DNA-binding MarR family transcriptional regulator [Actinoplanes lobatus]GGN68053.1 transcriptional regulator [Actinoplanes lobatus]GIE37178.1 transcriptional regulator [Actinoplanes lobatus]